MRQRRLTLVLFAGLLLCVLYSEAIACTCGIEADCVVGDAKKCANTRFKSAKTVFFGTVVDRDIKELPVKPPPPIASPDPGHPVVVDVTPQVVHVPYHYIATVEVEIAWKGFRTHRVFVRAEQSDGANCGINLQIGRSYLFFTSRQGNLFFASACTVSGKESLALLPKGRSLKTSH